MILCSDIRKCPQLGGLQIVNAKTIKQYEGCTEVEALICSRDVAQVCQYMNITAHHAVKILKKCRALIMKNEQQNVFTAANRQKEKYLLHHTT